MEMVIASFLEGSTSFAGAFTRMLYDQAFIDGFFPRLFES